MRSIRIKKKHWHEKHSEEEHAQQPSVARQWNEALLDAIRVDTPRPTVHSRNLFHSSVAMYDAWAAFDDMAKPYLLGQSVHEFECAYNGQDLSESSADDVAQSVSYAAYRVLSHRFQKSPGSEESLASFDELMDELGYDVSVTSTDYEADGPAALGNYIAQCVIDYGLQDNANEQDNYSYTDNDYVPFNTPMDPNLSGTQNGVLDINLWQPLIPVENQTQIQQEQEVSREAVADQTQSIPNQDMAQGLPQDPPIQTLAETMPQQDSLPQAAIPQEHPVQEPPEQDPVQRPDQMIDAPHPENTDINDIQPPEKKENIVEDDPPHDSASDQPEEEAEQDDGWMNDFLDS